jgi:hypothetical protein
MDDVVKLDASCLRRRHLARPVRSPTVSGQGQWLRGYAMALACAVAFGANPLIPFQRSQNISSGSPDERVHRNGQTVVGATRQPETGGGGQSR